MWSSRADGDRQAARRHVSEYPCSTYESSSPRLSYLASPNAWRQILQHVLAADGNILLDNDLAAATRDGTEPALHTIAIFT